MMRAADQKKSARDEGWMGGQNVPAPVTRATLPSSEADARPRGPGIWSYLLLGLVSVTPGIVSVFGLPKLVPDEREGIGCLVSFVSTGADLEEK
jgi:hypothetical protein